MPATNFKTENTSYRRFWANGLTYNVPRFQRDYSWSIEQWEDLWIDIESSLEEADENERFHYMGYLVLQSSNEKEFNVIDGQQRLTSISLIILAILKNLQRLVDNNKETDKNKTRLEQIRQTYQTAP